MQITKNSLATSPGPSEWFTGTVYIDTVATPSVGSRLQASSVHFTLGARTAWQRGGPIEIIRPGDRVFFEPGEEHWHGAAPDRFMTHLAMLEVDEHGNGVTWGQHVTDEEYSQRAEEKAASDGAQ
jgi:quercetin dioxygenase-like cupin family protein